MCIHPLSGDLCIAGARSATWALPRTCEPGWRVESSVFSAKCAGGFLGGDDLFLASNEAGTIAATDLRSARASWQPSRQSYFNSATSADGLTGVAQLAERKGDGAYFSILRAEGAAIHETATVYFRTDPIAMSLNRDGSRIAMSGAWGGIATYRTPTGEALPLVPQRDITSTYGLAWHGTDPARLIGLFTGVARRGFADSEDWIISWDTDTGERTAAVRTPTPANCLATEPGGTRLAEAGDDKLVRIRDAGTLAVLRSFRAHDGPINAIAWNPARAIIATGSTDRSVRLWNAETGTLIKELHIGLREPSALYFSPSGRRLACATPGEKTLIWELP